MGKPAEEETAMTVPASLPAIRLPDMETQNRLYQQAVRCVIRIRRTRREGGLLFSGDLYKILSDRTKQHAGKPARELRTGTEGAEYYALVLDPHYSLCDCRPV